MTKVGKPAITVEKTQKNYKLCDIYLDFKEFKLLNLIEKDYLLRN